MTFVEMSAVETAVGKENPEKVSICLLIKEVVVLFFKPRISYKLCVVSI